jgi:hypothetical protein
MQTLQKYVEQIKQDLDINEINISQVAKQLPNRRHFWTARCIEHKLKLRELKTKKDNIYKNVAKEVETESPIRFNKSNLLGAVGSTDEMKIINEQIQEQELLIEFLESVQKNFFSATYDIKNVIQLMQLEQS